MFYKNIMEDFDINLQQSFKEENEYLFIANQDNRLIYLSHPIKRKNINQLFLKHQRCDFVNSYLKFKDKKMIFSKDQTSIIIENAGFIQKNIQYTTNGILFYSPMVKGKILLNDQTTFICNDRTLFIANADKSPLLILNPLYNRFKNQYIKCYIVYKKINNQVISFEIKSDQQKMICCEINMYSNKLIYDTIIEKSHQYRNNVYSSLVFFNNQSEQEQLLLRFNHLPFLNLVNKKIKQAFLYLPLIYHSKAIEIISYAIQSKWCSFNTNWIQQPQYSSLMNEVEVLDKYLKINIKQYIENIANHKNIYHPGLVIQCLKGELILSTADSYYYPNIVEVILDES